MQVTASVPALAETRDWVEWYDDLREAERREVRARLLTASYEEIKAAPDLRHFFLLHSSDLAEEMPPGAERIAELHSVVLHLRSQGAAADEARRKAVGFMLAEYQRFLLDNPWAC